VVFEDGWVKEAGWGFALANRQLTVRFREILVNKNHKRILGAAFLGINADKVIRAVFDVIVREGALGGRKGDRLAPPARVRRRLFCYRRCLLVNLLLVAVVIVSVLVALSPDLVNYSLDAVFHEGHKDIF